MSPQDLAMIAVGILTVVWTVFRHRFVRRRALALPAISDTEFLAAFPEELAEARRGEILEQRERMAKTLGIPGSRLAPEETYERMLEHFGHGLDIMLGWSDLEDDLMEECHLAEITFSSDMMISVTAYIEAFLRATAKLEAVADQ